MLHCGCSRRLYFSATLTSSDGVWLPTEQNVVDRAYMVAQCLSAINQFRRVFLVIQCIICMELVVTVGIKTEPLNSNFLARFSFFLLLYEIKNICGNFITSHEERNIAKYRNFHMLTVPQQCTLFNMWC
jgi:hypothetical protein